MENREILSVLIDVFKEVFDDEELVLTRETTANDIEEWDSLNQIKLIVESERAFNIRLKSRDINILENNMARKSKDAAKKIKTMVKKADNKINKALAADILEAILSDGKYSKSEQKAVQWLRESEEVSFTRNTEKWLGRQLSNFNLAKHREEMMEEAKSRLLPGLMEAAGNNNTIGMDDAKKIVAFIIDDGSYSEEEQDTMDFLYNSGRMSAAVESFIQGELRAWRAERAHQAWVKKNADANIKKLLVTTSKMQKSQELFPKNS